MTEDFKKELIEAIKEVAAAFSAGGGAEIKFLIKETTAGELIGQIIVDRKEFLRLVDFNNFKMEGGQ